MASPYICPKNGQRLSWYEKYSTIDTNEIDQEKMFNAIMQTAIDIANGLGKPCYVDSKHPEWTVVLQDSTKDINVQMNLLRTETGKLSFEVQRRSGDSFIFVGIYKIIKTHFATFIPIIEKK